MNLAATGANDSGPPPTFPTRDNGYAGNAQTTVTVMSCRHHPGAGPKASTTTQRQKKADRLSFEASAYIRSNVSRRRLRRAATSRFSRPDHSRLRPNPNPNPRQVSRRRLPHQHRAYH